MKKAANEGTIELLYVDEAGVSCVPNVQRSWSPLGKPHSADASVGRKRANVLGALNYATKALHFEVCEHSVCRSDIVAFLQGVALASDSEKWTFAVMDNASIHHHFETDITQRWMIDYKFIPLYLPPYSPELNLIEILWKQAKYHWRAFVSWTRHTLVTEVQALFAGFGTKFHINYA